jgi:hypothetical protein
LVKYQFELCGFVACAFTPWGCRTAARIAEATVAKPGNSERLEIFSQEDRKRRKSEQKRALGFALPPAGLLPSRAPKARRTKKFSPSDLPIFL